MRQKEDAAAVRLAYGARAFEDPDLRGAADLRLEPHFTHNGWIRDSRSESDWIMNDRLHFGIGLQGDEVSLQYHWAALGEQSGEEKPAARELLIDLPPKVRDYPPKGPLRLMFDAWS